MSKVAMSDKRLAISEKRVFAARLQRPRGHEVWLIAYCLWLIAAFPSAISFTVTALMTSVTHRGLAESVLINIGKVYSGQGLKALQTAEYKALGHLHCSFGEATCIQ